MNEIRLIEIGEEIHSENSARAAEIRRRLRESGTVMVNLMASPGSGKTTLLVETIRALLPEMRIGVVEADIDSEVDAQAVAERNVPVVQMHTGGFCHVDAFMMEKCLDAVDLSAIDLLFLENVGNLICPAQSDTGAHFNVVLLSVPEGDDKPLKYPIIFRRSDLLIITKTDYLPAARFDCAAVRMRAAMLNPSIKVFELSAETGEGMEPWLDWVRALILRDSSHLEP